MPHMMSLTVKQHFLKEMVFNCNSPECFYVIVTGA